MITEPKRVVRDGKVAVLVSPGYGAGWSTWAAGEEVMFCPEIVAAVEAKKTLDEICAIGCSPPGILQNMNGRTGPEGVQKCDSCAIYASDKGARAALKRILGRGPPLDPSVAAVLKKSRNAPRISAARAILLISEIATQDSDEVFRGATLEIVASTQGKR